MILFKDKLHKKYLQIFLTYSGPYHSLDSSRVTVAYFALSGLDVLNNLNAIEDKKQTYIDWFYYLLCNETNVAGFQNFATFNNIKQFKSGHIAATYSALNALLLLGDDLSKINRKAILDSIKLLQLEDGSFIGAKSGTENDMRFIYCAASICFILNDWSGMNVEKAVQYILKSLSYDGGFGQGPNLESHGGSTYCAIASLALANQLHRIGSVERDRLICWLLNLQVEGFRGRTNKVEDTCYTYWVGASLKILNGANYVNKERLINFVLATQDFQTGGFGRCINSKSDPLHTYLSLAGLSLFNFDSLNEVMPTLNITYRAYDHLKCLHEKWEIDQ